MDDFKSSTMSNDYFPPDLAITLDYFTYVGSSKPIIPGDLIVYAHDDTEASGNIYWIVGTCELLHEDNTLSLLSSEYIIIAPIERCKRLTVTIPTNKDHFINN